MGRDIKQIIEEIDSHAMDWRRTWGEPNYAPNLQLAIELADEVRGVKMSSRDRVVQAVRDAADSWQPNSPVPFEEMVAGFLFEEDGYEETN